MSTLSMSYREIAMLSEESLEVREIVQVIRDNTFTLPIERALKMAHEIAMVMEKYTPKEYAEPIGSLTPRELEISLLAAKGYTNLQIAEEVRLAEPTVKFHLRNAFKKLNVSTRTELAKVINYSQRPHDAEKGSNYPLTLTSRELEIARLVAEGYTNVQISKRLGVTVRTITFHVSNSLQKAGVENRTQLSNLILRQSEDEKGVATLPIDDQQAAA